MAAVLETKKLTKMYGKNRGVLDLSLSVEAGEIFGFIGPNGAGKSTTIRTALGLISSTAGEALLFGEAAAKNRTEVLARVGYMPSEAMFYGSMRVGELLDFSARLQKKDCKAEFVRYITPFAYADAATIAADAAVNVPLLLLGLAYAAAFLAIGITHYARKDIAA